MPYIQLDEKNSMDSLVVPPMETAGSLNYALTMTMLSYLDAHGLSYQTINDISGALTEALAEFRRRITVPYEEMKRQQNGDVYYWLDFTKPLI